MDIHRKTAALLDRYEPEFANYLAGEAVDLYLVPCSAQPFKWPVPPTAERRCSRLIAMARQLKLFFDRHFSRRAIAESQMITSRWLARSYARKLPADCTHLIVVEHLLPFLWLDGVLQGRRFSVLLTRPPLSVEHERLNQAARALPHERALMEFRPPRELVEAESQALHHAERVITPHQSFARFFPNLRKLGWQQPEVVPPADVRNPSCLLLPSPLAARDGAHAALGAAERLNLSLLVVGHNIEGLAAPSDMIRFISESEIPWNEVAAVVHPALFESWPRLHLHALALGIPVIATEACGLEEGGGVTLVPFNDEEALVRAVERAVGREVEAAREPLHQDQSQPHHLAALGQHQHQQTAL